MKPIHDESNANRVEIEKRLASYKDGATINQIASDLELSWITVKKHLDYLQAIGRADVKRFGNSQIYFLNGKGTWTKQIHLSSMHTLFLDTFYSPAPFNEAFLRIKETKKSEGEWKVVGNVMITKDKLGEVIEFLTNLKDHIEQYPPEHETKGGETA